MRCNHLSMRKQWEPVLENVASRLVKDEIDVTSRGRATARHYYCTSVMDVARHLRRFTKARDEQGQHDVLKILFKYYRYGRKGRFEIKNGMYRLDIWIDGAREAIEVKTIVDVTVAKVKGKASLILALRKKRHRRVDRAWIAFFYKFKGGASPKPACKYLLCWIDIGISGIVNARELNQDLTMIMHESKIAVAKRISVDDNIIIPVDNIMLVEELERESKEKDAIIDDQAKTIDDQATTIDDQATTIDDQATTIAELKKRLGIE